MQNSKLQHLQSQQMELIGNPGKRPITLSPAYRYKQDGGVQKQDIQQQIIVNKIQQQVNTQALEHASANDSLMLPGPGGVTPTNIVSSQITCINTFQKPSMTANETAQQKSILNINQNLSGNVNHQGVQGTLSLQNQQKLVSNGQVTHPMYSNQGYKVPTKLINSVASGLQSMKTNVNAHNGQDAQAHLTQSNTKAKMQLKTQQLSSQFINSRTSHPHNSHTSVFHHGVAQASNSEVLPNINNKQFKQHLEGASDVQQRTTNDQSVVKTIPSIFDSQPSKLVNNRSISEFHHKTSSEHDNGVNQLVLNPKSAVYTKGGRELPNKTFFIKNKSSSRNQPNAIYMLNNEEPSVEANYGLTNRSNILNRSQHPPVTHLRSSGESQLIQAGKMATSNMRGLPQPSAEETEPMTEKMTKTTPIINQKSFLNNNDSAKQAMNAHQKYLFNKTAACSSKLQFIDPYQQSLESQLPAKTQERSDYLSQSQNNRQYSISDKIQYLNQKLNQSSNDKHTIESKSFVQNEGNHIFQTAGGFDGQNVQNLRAQNFKNYYTTFTGPIAVTNSYGQDISNLREAQTAVHQRESQSSNQTPNLKHDLNENQLKIRKFLNLVDLQDLVEKETQYRINQSSSAEVSGVQQSSKAPVQSESSKSNQRQGSFNAKLVAGRANPQYNQAQKNQPIDPNIWKHFQNLLQFDQNNSELSSKLTFSQKKTLLSLRAQLLKNSSLGLNSEEICKTIKQFIEHCNLDELYKAPMMAGAGRRQRSKQMHQSSTSPTTQQNYHLSHANSATVDHGNGLANNTSIDRMVNSHFSKNTNQVFSSFKESQHASSRQGHSSQSNQAKVININKLNINIQQYQNPGLQTMQNGVTGVSYAQANQQNQQQSRNGNKFQTTTSQYTQKSQNQGSSVPKHVQDTLFIMDCQLFGLLKHVHLLNLEQGKQMPLSQEKDTKLSEAELVHFIMSRANSATSLMFKELPKLSEEAKQIINMVKAQQQVELQDEITRVETLIIEIDYVDYKNKLLQALFNNYGDSVLETIIHKIQQGPAEQETIKNLNQQHFQTINEYVNSIRSMHHQNQKTEFQHEMQKQGINQPQGQTNHFREARQSSQHLFEPREFEQSNNPDEMQENLGYLFPNIYDPTIQSLNFTPGYRGKKFKDKKINFGVVVKETKLYHALRFADQLTTDNNLERIGDKASKKCLSSYLVTNDCTLLRFMLFCSHAGIIRSAQASLRMFFKHVFIVIKPGFQVNHSSGQITYNSALPQVDVDKVTNYIQNQIKKKQKAMESYNHLKRLGSQVDGKESKEPKEKNQQSTPSTSTQNHGKFKGLSQNNLNTAASIDRNKSSVSLNSCKSTKQLETAKIDIANHFNSLHSSIRADLPPTQPTTIKVYHKPYTHLDQTRFQKIFKVYNEFVSLTFKNKLIYAQSGESMSQDITDFSQQQAARICKLASQMGIKDLPRKHSLLRSPLLELFRNHRQLTRIKEQILRHIFRTLNEENDISSNFNSIVLSGYSFQLDKNQNIVLREAETQTSFKHDADSKQMGIQSQQQSNSHGRAQNQTVSTQKSSIYKYQVGYGNNHFCIKSIMKNRRWWVQATSKDYVSNFDDAQIIWTQWCKTKLCNHLCKMQQFKFEYKATLDKIEARPPNKTQQNSKSVYNNSDQKQVLNDKCKTYFQGSISPLKTESNQAFNKDVRQAIKQSSRQHKKTSVLMSTQYKSIENQMSSPEKASQTTEEAKQVSPFQKSAKKNKVSKLKHTYEEENGSDEECNTEQGKTAETADQASVKLSKMLRQVKSMKERFQRVYNRLEFNQHLNNKKALFINMRNFYNYCCDNEDVFNTLPLTFHIKDSSADPQFQSFTKYYNELKVTCSKDSERKNVWVIKPGENSNRGQGIKVESEFNRIKSAVDQVCSKYGSHGKRTVILQKYIDNPLLYCRRKFDVRCFALVTCVNGVMKAYFYRDGYIRTASREFSLGNLNNKFIHLVNDAIQQNSDEYGKFETANKLSYQEFQKYLNNTLPLLNINFERDLIMQVRKIVTDSIRATFHLLDSKKRLNSYELFGYDFMFDANFKPYLIEVNSNPCLEFSSSLLAKIFTAMLDNTFRIAVDPLFPPPQEGFASKKSAEGIELCPENRFDLIFDERIDGPDLLEKLKKIDLDDVNEVKLLDELEGSEDEQENEESNPSEVVRVNSQRSINDTPMDINEESKDPQLEDVEVISKEEQIENV